MLLKLCVPDFRIRVAPPLRADLPAKEMIVYKFILKYVHNILFSYFTKYLCKEFKEEIKVFLEYDHCKLL